MNNTIVAKGQKDIRKEIQKSEAKILQGIKVPEEISGINFLYIGDFEIHHMNRQKKFFLNGNMSLKEFREKVNAISEGNTEGNLALFKEELENIVLIPKWFHKYFQKEESELKKKCGTDRNEFYRQMGYMLANEFDKIENLKLIGEDVRDWMGTILQLKNTVYVKNDDYEKIKDLLKQVYEIIRDNIKSSPPEMQTASNKVIAKSVLKIAKNMIASNHFTDIEKGKSLVESWNSFVSFDEEFQPFYDLYESCLSHKKDSAEFEEKKLTPVFSGKYKSLSKDEVWDKVFAPILKKEGDLAAILHNENENTRIINKRYYAARDQYKAKFFAFIEIAKDLLNDLSEIEQATKRRTVKVNYSEFIKKLESFISKEMKHDTALVVRGNGSSFKVFNKTDLETLKQLSRSVKVIFETTNFQDSNAMKEIFVAKKNIEESFKRFRKLVEDWEDTFDWSQFYII